MSTIYTYNKTVAGRILYIDDILIIFVGGHSLGDTEAKTVSCFIFVCL